MMYLVPVARQIEHGVVSRKSSPQLPQQNGDILRPQLPLSILLGGETDASN